MSVRLSYADCDGNGTINPATEILEDNNYYPFGLQHQGYNNIANSCRSEEAEAYKYNGKEYEDAFGLNIYEMDLRQLDPGIGRWMVMDPVKHHDYSPYSAFDNNPVYWSDPSGADATTLINSLWDKSGNGLTSYTLEDGQVVDTYYDKNAADIVRTMLAFVLSPDETNGGGGDGNGNGGQGKNKGANPQGIGFHNGTYTFFGVPVNIMDTNYGAASYALGALNIYRGTWDRFRRSGTLYTDDGYLLMHEYGHYLQAKYGGEFQYIFVAIASMVDYWQTDYEGHQKHWSEIQGSTLAYYFFGRPEPFLEDNKVNPKYVNEQHLNSLLNLFIKHPDYKP
ncbi:hypothetical protein MG290_08400 [Flavobacterium sp. CBA20B-1]|uniref:RHS repeat-associated core domain-containing protein n=1 Tax=unclassified Flavobacterium TaxID=196869 RepID=UPI0022252901|nr:MULTISPECIES: RHS repeat-associated core domain-containing protein [unclassified Flavobacterium]WCM40982.1 hypothetical protein MG290_08400 [Flavobacterium sp. CBA20B-1]